MLMRKNGEPKRTNEPRKHERGKTRNRVKQNFVLSNFRVFVVNPSRTDLNTNKLQLNA